MVRRNHWQSRFVKSYSQRRKLRRKRQVYAYQKFPNLRGSWPFIPIAGCPRRFMVGQYFLFNGVNELLEKGFAKWDRYDLALSKHLQACLNNTLPQDINKMITSYLVISRHNIQKDRNEILHLSNEEGKCIKIWGGTNRRDRFSLFCLFFSQMLQPILATSDDQKNIGYRFFQHFFSIYSLEEQLVVALGLLFTAKSSFSDGKFLLLCLKREFLMFFEKYLGLLLLNWVLHNAQTQCTTASVEAEWIKPPSGREFTPEIIFYLHGNYWPLITPL